MAKKTPDSCNNAVLRRAARTLGRLYDDALNPSGLRATQYGMLAQIAFMEGPSMRSLADALVMDLSALGHTLKPMIRDGLVKLVPSAEDRRVKRAVPTARGQKVLEQATPMWRAAQARLETALGAKQAADLRAALIYLSSDEFSTRFAQA